MPGALQTAARCRSEATKIPDLPAAPSISRSSSCTMSGYPSLAVRFWAPHLAASPCHETLLPSARGAMPRLPRTAERAEGTRLLDAGSTHQRPHHPPWYATVRGPSIEPNTPILGPRSRDAALQYVIAAEGR